MYYTIAYFSSCRCHYYESRDSSNSIIQEGGELENFDSDINTMNHT